MKTKPTQLLLAGFLLSMSAVSHFANAGLISHYAGANATTRTCPLASNEAECIAQSSENPQQLISREEETYFAGDYTRVASENGNSWAEGNFSQQGHFLPEAKVYASSDVQERSSGNIVAYQEYTWLGGDDTLTISSYFDYAMSGGMWGDVSDSYFYAHLAVLFDINDNDYFYPGYDDQDLYTSSTFAPPRDVGFTVNPPIEIMINVLVDVSFGDTFYVYNIFQVGGMNGGWAYANTSGSSVSAQTATDEEVSRQLVASNFAVSVPEPSSLLLFALTLFGLVGRRLNNAC